MQEYKVDFEKEHRVKWDYMNSTTIRRYLEFKEKQDKKHGPNETKPTGRVNSSLMDIEMSHVTETDKLLRGNNPTVSGMSNYQNDIKEIVNDKRKQLK
jgi:hypothetical protein